MADGPHNTEPHSTTPPGTRPRSRLRRFALAGTLAVLGLGAAGAVGTVAADGMGFRGHGFGGPMGGFGMERALRAVDASPQQRTEIRAIMDGARSQMWPLMDQFHDQRQAFMTLLQAEPLDRAAIESLRQDALASADAASALGLAAFLDAAEVLSPEQRARLLQMRERRGRGHHRR